MKRILIGIACNLLWITSARAQICTGGVSFGTAPIQVGADGVFSSNTHSLVPEASFGNEQYFGRVGANFSSFSGIDNGAKGIFGAAGAELKVDAANPISVCPMVSVGKAWGPSPAPDLNLSSYVVQVGGRVGFVAAKTGQATIVPTIGLSFNYLNTTSSSSGLFQGFTSGTSFGNLQFGAGFIFNDRFSLIPSVVVPFHYDQGETAFSIYFATRLGS
jgi:hypothetical protein